MKNRPPIVPLISVVSYIFIAAALISVFFTGKFLINIINQLYLNQEALLLVKQKKTGPSLEQLEQIQSLLINRGSPPEIPAKLSNPFASSLTENTKSSGSGSAATPRLLPPQPR